MLRALVGAWLLAAPVQSLAPILAARLGERIMLRDQGKAPAEAEEPIFDIVPSSVQLPTATGFSSEGRLAQIQMPKPDQGIDASWEPSAKDWSVLAMPRLHQNTEEARPTGELLQWKPQQAVAIPEVQQAIYQAPRILQTPRATTSFLHTANFVPPQRAYVPPQRAYAPPQRAYALPQRAYVPPQRAYAPPQRAYALPQRAYAPPQRAYVPPRAPQSPPQVVYRAPAPEVNEYAAFLK